MATPRRKCRLADVNHADVDLRNYSKVIIETIEQVIPGKNPKVFKEYFSTDVLPSPKWLGMAFIFALFFLLLSLPEKFAGNRGILWACNCFVVACLGVCHFCFSLRVSLWPGIFPKPLWFSLWGKRSGKLCEDISRKFRRQIVGEKSERIAVFVLPHSFDQQV